MSALQFTYYLAKTLEPERSNQLADHPYAEQNARSSIPDHATEHNYCIITQKDKIDIDMKYVDNISKVTINHISMENFKHNTSEILKLRDLNVNYEKTEQYIINRSNKNCVNISEACWTGVQIFTTANLHLQLTNCNYCS